MYGFRKIRSYGNTDIEVNESAEGELIETKVERISKLNEPITDGAPYLETEESEGVIPVYNVRTDPFDAALDEVTEVHRNSANKYAENMAKLNEKLQGGQALDGEETGGEDA